MIELAIAEMAGYLKDGRMKSKEDVVRGSVVECGGKREQGRDTALDFGEV